MSNSLRNTALALVAVAGLSLSTVAISHYDDKEIPQSYRQSWFTLVAMNFGPMVAMLKGEMPWDDEKVQVYATQLATLTSMDVSRGFADGTDKGTTRAKPDIWKNKADFMSKFEDLDTAAQALKVAATAGDKGAIAMSIAATGKACKACHDDYKSKDYLY